MLDIQDNKAHRTHWHPDIREMIGRAAVLYMLATEALEDSDAGTFAGAFTEIRRIQDRVREVDRRHPDHTQDTCKGLRVMVETIRNRGVEGIPGVTWHGMDLRFPRLIASEARTPDTSGIDSDLLRLLGDYLHWHSWCFIDHMLLPIELERFRERSGDTPEYKQACLEMAAERAGDFIWCRDELATPTATLLEHTLDAGLTPEAHPAMRTFRLLRSEISGMEADIRRLCAEHGIRPVYRLVEDPPFKVGPSTECGTKEMGRLFIAYSDGLSAIQGRRRRMAPYMAGLRETTGYAMEIDPAGSNYHRYETLQANGKADHGEAPLNASSVAHALRVEMCERGYSKFKNCPEGLESPGIGMLMGDDIADSSRMETLGMLAAEYAGIVYAAKDAPYSIWRDRMLIRVNARRARANTLIHSLTTELDEAHVPDTDPVICAVDFVGRDIPLVIAEMNKELEKADRIAKRLRRRAA